MIVALLTDFGTRDHYVGTMKGVILSVCPEASLVDLTHDIPPQDILAGALELSAAWRYFPEGTVFLAVVDPGVGSPRRGIAAEANGYRFVGPDNGVLSLAVRQASAAPGGAPARVVELRERKFARPDVSRTFEGRDRFAPAAGWLARGTALSAFGPQIDDAVVLAVATAKVTGDGVAGEVVRIDRFGNLITNIEQPLIEPLGGDVSVTIAGREITGLVATYAEAPAGDLCALIGSTGHLEIAANSARAADLLNASRGAAVLVSRRPTPGA